MKWLVTIFYVNCQHESSHVLVHGLWLDKLGSILGNGVSHLFPTKPGDLLPTAKWWSFCGSQSGETLKLVAVLKLAWFNPTEPYAVSYR